MQASIINLERYPLDNLSSARGQEWLDEVRDSLEQDGSCLFPEFVYPKALEQMASQARSIESSILHYGPRVAEIEAHAPRYPA